MTAVVVADASPLIAFQEIGQLQLLRAVFGELTVPPSVLREVLASVSPEPWIVERALTQPIVPLVLRANLGAGESEALSLAMEIGKRLSSAVMSSSTRTSVGTPSQPESCAGR